MKVIISDQATVQLEEIVDFLIFTANQSVAFKIHTEIIEALDKLPEFPNKGQLELYLDNRGKGHRRVVVGNYKIVYRLLEDAIFVTDIFDTRQDPNKLLG